jgi:hypothetical protein
METGPVSETFTTIVTITYIISLKLINHYAMITCGGRGDTFPLLLTTVLRYT